MEMTRCRIKITGIDSKIMPNNPVANEMMMVANSNQRFTPSFLRYVMVCTILSKRKKVDAIL